MEFIKLVGYWNRSTSSPEITFNPPEDLEDTRRLVIITLELPPDTNKLDNKFELRDLSNKASKVNRGLKNLIASTKRLR